MTTITASEISTPMGASLTAEGFSVDQYPTDDTDPRSNIAIDITRDDAESVTAQVTVTPEGELVEGWVAILDGEGHHFAKGSGFIFADEQQLASVSAFIDGIKRAFG